jgi:hypothetical protein
VDRPPDKRSITAARSSQFLQSARLRGGGTAARIASLAIGRQTGVHHHPSCRIEANLLASLASRRQRDVTPLLYSVTKGQSAIRDLFSVKHDRAGNLPPLPAVYLGENWPQT